MTEKRISDIFKQLDELSSELNRDGYLSKDAPKAEVHLFEIDLDGHLLKVPSLIVEITGFSEEELDLLSLQSITFTDDRNRIMSAVLSIASGAPVVITEIELFSETSGAHPVELIMLPRLKGTEVKGAWGIVKDIKGRRSLEQSLVQTKEVQERSQRFLSDFVSLMAREIRQPLTTLLLTLEMLDSGHFGDLNAQQKNRIGQMIGLVDRLKGILNEAIDTSKTANEDIKLERDQVSFGELLKEAISVKIPAMTCKHITHTLKLPEGRTSLPLDRKAMLEALCNLVDHSIGQVPDGGSIQIEVDIKGGALLFALSDSGPGIPEEDVEQIFERFHVDRDKERGSFIEGLSLYLTKRIVETHGGRIWCESFPDLGSSFFMTLPFEKQSEER